MVLSSSLLRISMKRYQLLKLNFPLKNLKYWISHNAKDITWMSGMITLKLAETLIAVRKKLDLKKGFMVFMKDMNNYVHDDYS